MKRLSLPLALAATAALLWHSVTPAQACSCLAPTGDRAAFYTSSADIVLVGTVNEIVDTEERDQPDFDLRVSVEQYLKGSGPREIIADDPIGGGDCGMFDPSYLGKRYVLFLRDTGQGFRTGQCSGNAPASEAFVEQVTAVAGTEPINPTNAGSGADSSARDVALAVAAVAFPIAFVLAASFVFPAKGARM